MSLADATEQTLDAIAEKHGKHWTESKQKQFAALVADVKAYKPKNKGNIMDNENSREVCEHGVLITQVCSTCGGYLKNVCKSAASGVDEILEIMCAAHWDLTASIKWKDIPEDWKPFYRDRMRKALEAVMK